MWRQLAQITESDVQRVHQNTVLQKKIKKTVAEKKHYSACFYVTTNCC